MASWKTKKSNALFSAILSLQTLDEAQRFFRDLLTGAEIREFSERWYAAKLLERKTPYLTITRLTGLSSTTIARVQRWRTRGMGGYRLVFRRLRKKNTSLHHHEHLPSPP
jgi:TrpR-related protein YerC/YecD